MLRKRERDLRTLIESFVDAFGTERIADLESYVDHCESGLAIEILSDWIYEEDVPVSADQEAAILKSSNDYRIDSSRHAFIGLQPPYPDLRTPKQIAESASAVPPSMEEIQRLALSNRKLEAVRMYRALTESSYEEAVTSVESLAAQTNKTTA